jgi:hypothetical protein
MPSGPPLPLLPQFPLEQLVPLLKNKAQIGAWLREARREIPLRIQWGSQTYRTLIGRDLGSLLRSCDWIAVRLGQEPVLLRAEELIRCRALQVVTGTPYLPSIEGLAEILSGAQLEPGGFSVPTYPHPPEEVLAICLAHGIPVTESRIDYRV